jgi:hypothetical protein
MASSILQGGLLNTTKKEGVLSQSSRSSARGRCLGNTFFYSRTRGDFTREVFNYLVILFLHTIILSVLQVMHMLCLFLQLFMYIVTFSLFIL